jgi:hypothetical protein
MRNAFISILASLALLFCVIHVACQQETPDPTGGGTGSGGTTTTAAAIFPTSIGFTTQPNAIAAATTSGASGAAANYVNLFYFLMTKMDRDYAHLTAGVAAPGLISYVEGFMNTLNNIGFTGAATSSVFLQAGLPNASFVCTGPASSACTNYKFLIRASTEVGTLFGVSKTFTYDVVAWANNGGGFARYLEGSFAPGTSNAGQGNFTLVTCTTCTPVSHGTLEWDATGTTTHVQGVVFNVNTNSAGSDNGGLVFDMSFNPTTTETLLTYGINNNCDTTSEGGPTCDQTAFTTGYAGQLHSKWSTGNVFAWGLHNVNSSTATPSTTSDQMCIDVANPPTTTAPTQDTNTTTACQTDGTNNFTALTAPYSPFNASNVSWGTGVWPLPDITDTPTF